jgi:hypothetical protein
MNKRTIESVLDLITGREIFASNFFNTSIDEIFKIRYDFETDIREKQPRYVCYFCRQPIKIRGKRESKRILHFAHLRDSDECPFKTNSKYTKEELLRIKYNGAKESKLHQELKSFIADSLTSNQELSKGIEFVEKELINRHLAIPKVWKRPDVSSKYFSKTVVFELQLSTTFLSVINSRQEFYRENKTFIIWVFNVFETNEERRKFTQSDIFYNNNRNGFELDELSKEKSFQEHDLIVKCNYQKPFIKNNEINYEWFFEYVKLSDLTFNSENYKVYYFDVDGARKKLKREIEVTRSRLILTILKEEESKITELFIKGYQYSEDEKKHIVELFNKHVRPKEIIETNTFEFRIIWANICLKLNSSKLIKELKDDFSLRKTITDILSLKLNKIIGYAFKKQIQISHRLIDTRPWHLNLYLNAIKVYQPQLIKEEDISNKFIEKIDRVKQTEQEQKYNANIIEKLFPELKKK